MQRQPGQRIGNENGIDELKSHPWFKSFDWDLLACKRMESPFVPDITIDNFDQNHVNNLEWKDADAV